MTARQRAEALRLETPRLEPDDAFVERMAAAARTSRPSVTARRRLQSLRVGTATVGVVGLTVGGAWAAGTLVEREDQDPGRPPANRSSPPISPPSDRPTTAPPPIAPSGTPDRGRAPGERGNPGGNGRDRDHDRGRHRGPRLDHPGKGRGADHDRGRPPGLPAPGHQGKGADKRDERADPGGPKGTGDGRRPDRPR